MNDEMRWRECPFAVVDVETTGLDPETQRVIEIAIVHMCDGEVTGSYSSLVNPDQEIPEEVVKLTGITQDDLKDAPRFVEIAEEVRRHLTDRVFLAYNLSFDRAFIKAELERAGHEFPSVIPIDPLVFVRELHKNAGSKRLGAVAERLGLTLTNAHRAKDDAIVAGQVLYALSDQLPQHLGELRLLQEQWEQQQKNEMASWKTRRTGSAIDERVGSGIDRGNALGPAYMYGDDTDPVRAMFRHLPDSGASRRA